MRVGGQGYGEPLRLIPNNSKGRRKKGKQAHSGAGKAARGLTKVSLCEQHHANIVGRLVLRAPTCEQQQASHDASRPKAEPGQFMFFRPEAELGQLMHGIGVQAHLGKGSG